MELQDDNTIVQEILNGKMEKYEIFVSRHQEKIFYLGMKFFKNFHDAEDFTQDVFLQAFNKLNTFLGKVPFIAWLYRIAKNMAINKYHFQKKLYAEFEFTGEYETDNESPESTLLDNELEKRINTLLEELPAIANIIIRMHFYDGLKYKEISSILDVPVSTIKSHVFRSKQIIKSKLQRYLTYG